VAAGRPLSKEQIDEVGQGRVWTGRQAMERKLIDHVGGLHEATARARELAGLPADARVENVYRPAGSFFERLLFGSQAAVRGAGSRFRLCAAGPEEPSLPKVDSQARLTALERLLPGFLSLSPAQSPWELWALRRSLSGYGSPGSAIIARAENPILEPLGTGY